MAVQHDTLNYQPPKQLMQFEHDLAPLMMFLADEGDALVAERPSDEVLTFWRSRGVAVPEFVTLAEGRRRVAAGATLRPWGMSREVLYRFGGHALADGFTDEHRRLFSRATSVMLDDALARLPLPDIFVQDERPVLVADEAVLASMVRERCCVVKSMWSASGRGVSLVNKPEFVDAAIARYGGSIRRDGQVVVEPLLSRVADVALLFFLHGDGCVEYLGRNYYRSDAVGRFGVELIGIDPIAAYVASGEWPSDWNEQAVSALSVAIASLGIERLYSGPIGVDSMLYREADGRMKMRLCIEANMRYTMGNVNLAISRCFPGIEAEWGVADTSDILNSIKSVLDGKDH